MWHAQLEANGLQVGIHSGRAGLSGLKHAAAANPRDCKDSNWYDFTRDFERTNL